LADLDASHLPDLLAATGSTMPRKAFLKDLEEAAQPGRFERIVSVRAGEDAGTVRFTCLSDILMEGEVVIEALIPGKSFLLFLVVINAHR